MINQELRKLAEETQLLLVRSVDGWGAWSTTFIETPAKNITSVQQIFPMIDHTQLKPETTTKEIEKLCKEATENNFATVCIPPNYVSLGKKLLEKSQVLTITVIGFPLGYNKTEVKLLEIKQALLDGAQEIDFVLNISDLKNKNYQKIFNEFKAIREACPVPVKVILETCILNTQEKIVACLIAARCKIDFVKTSTGFSFGGATAEDIALMRFIVGPNFGVKASGGIRSFEDAKKMIAAGASRLGTSSGVAFLTGQITSEDY